MRTPSFPGNPPGLAWCSQCGRRCQWRGTRWVHLRPSPDGPNDHNAVAVATRS